MSRVTDNIDLLLTMKGIGKYKFYKGVGISAPAYTQWKQGKNNPRLSKLQQIAEYLGVSVSTFTDERAVIFETEKPEEQETAAPEGDGGLSPDHIKNTPHFKKSCIINGCRVFLVLSTISMPFICAFSS